MQQQPIRSTCLLSVTVIGFICLASCQQSFLTEPVDTSVVVGQTITLQCLVMNKTGSLAWTKGGNVPISIERNIIDPVNRGRYSIIGTGDGDFSLQITDAELTDAGDYQCQVTSSSTDSEIQSVVAAVEVIDVPIQAFAIEPSNTNVPVDTTATLLCTVTEKAGNLQWEKDGVIISNETAILDPSLVTYSITGDHDQGVYNLQILLAQESDEGVFKCVVTASGFSEEISSSNAVLSISTSGQRLEIVPFNTVVREGTTSRLLCRVADKAGVQTWLKNGQQLNEDTEIILSDSRYSIIGDQSSGEYHLQITNVRPDDAGSYFCTVSGVEGDTPISSGGATLTVTAAIPPNDGYPQCSQTPSIGLREGDNVTMTCVSNGGEPQPTLTWMTDAQEVYNGEYQDLNDQARNYLTLTLTSDLRYVVFTCQSSHPSYSSPQTCSLTALDFELEPTIVISVSPADVVVKEDEGTTIECSATGTPPVIGYSWFYNGIEIIPGDARFVIETTAAKDLSYLQIVSATKSFDEGVVSCEARNRIDSEMTYAIVKIEESNLYTIVLVAMVLIALVVFIVIFVIFIAPCLYSKHMKKSRVSNDETLIATISDRLQHNFFITGNGHLLNGDDSSEKRRKHKKKKQHRSHRDTDSDTRRAEKKLKEIERHDVIYDDPKSLLNGTTKSLKSDVFPPPRYTDLPPVLPTKLPDIEKGKRDTKASVDNGDILRPLSRTPDLKTINELERKEKKERRSSKTGSKRPSKSSRRVSKTHKVSLSPGEYAARDEYEKKLRELTNIREEITGDNTSKKRSSKVSAST